MTTEAVVLALRTLDLSQGDQEGISDFLLNYFGSDDHECCSGKSITVIIVLQTDTTDNDFSTESLDEENSDDDQTNTVLLTKRVKSSLFHILWIF